MILPNPLPTDPRTLKILTDQAIASCQGSNPDFATAYNSAAAQYPALFEARAKSLAPPAQAPLSHACVPQFNHDTAGLYEDAAFDERCRVWSDCGNNFDPANADKGFDSLVSSRARAGRDYPDAEKSVRAQFPRLAAQADMIKSQNQAAGFPPVGLPGSPKFTTQSGVRTPPAAKFNKGFPPVSSPFDAWKASLAVGNDGMTTSLCRQTLCDAVKKHLDDHPDHTPVRAQREVLAAHPTLAAALRKSQSATQPADNGESDDPAASAGGASGGAKQKPEELLKVWGGFLDDAKQQAALGSEFSKKLVPAIQQLMARIKATGTDFNFA